MALIAIIVAVVVGYFLPSIIYDTSWQAMINIVADKEIFPIKDYNFDELAYTLKYALSTNEVWKHIAIVVGISIAIAVVLEIVLKLLVKKMK